MSDRDSGSSILWFLAGLGIGAVVGILYAPQSGAETREAIRAKAEEGRDYVRNRAREVRAQADEWVGRGKEVISQQKEQIRSAIDAGKQAYREKTAPESAASKNV